MTNWKGLSASERFDLRTEPNPNGCLDWTGHADKDGYGRFRRDKTPTEKKGKLVRINRWVWERHNGPIPSGLLVRHTCDRPSCVNIDHLLLGTAKDNAQDAVLRGRYPGRQMTHCLQGHEFTIPNTLYRKNGTRRCRTCHNLLRRKA